MKPDFTGDWILNRPASILSPRASAIERGAMWIDHRDGKCAFRMRMQAAAEPVEHAFEIPTEEPGAWDGDTLVFHYASPGAAVSMTWLYTLENSGQRLRAAESLRAPGNDQDNIWIFDRSREDAG